MSDAAPAHKNTSYVSNATAAQIAQRLRSAERVMITTHVKPDGDAIGSTVALTRALTNCGIRADLFLMGPLEPTLLPIVGATPYRLIQSGPKPEGMVMPDDQYDAVVVLDTGAWSQLEPLTDWLKRHHPRVIGIDHHSRGDDVASMRLIDPTCASSTQTLVAVLDAMNCPITGGVGGIAEALFVGLAADTGWFRFNNADAAAFMLAGRLLQYGVDKSRLYQLIEENYGPQRLTLEARALASLEYACNGTVAIQMLQPADFAAAGGAAEDLTGIVNTPMTVGKVRVSILLSQTPDNTQITKISFRSKPPLPDAATHEFTDVNALAGKFGGGGHVHAAGARIKASIEHAKAMVLQALGCE